MAHAAMTTVTRCPKWICVRTCVAAPMARLRPHRRLRPRIPCGSSRLRPCLCIRFSSAPKGAAPFTPWSRSIELWTSAIRFICATSLRLSRCDLRMRFLLPIRLAVLHCGLARAACTLRSCLGHRELTRRDAIRGMVSTGALALIKPASTLAQEPALAASSDQVEISLTTISPRTVRITAQLVKDGQTVPLQSDGALLDEHWSSPFARLRALSGSRILQSGDLRITVSGTPWTLRAEGPAGAMVQELRLDTASSELQFNTGEGPLLGLGQGGPQYDRRGSSDRMVSGQGGYHLGTHGARVPIQFLIGTGGWGMFVHSPLGAFDLSGKVGRLRPAEGAAALPLDVLVIAAAKPTTILAEYAKITGLPEMPPLWSLGYQQSYRTLGTPQEIMQEA